MAHKKSEAKERAGSRGGLIIKVCLVLLAVALLFLLYDWGFAPPEAPDVMQDTPTGADLPPDDSPPPTPVQNPAPRPSPSPSPSPEPPPEPDPEPEPEPPPHPATLFFPGSIEETDPRAPAFNHRYDIMADGEIVEEFDRPYRMFFGLPEDYTQMEGITTFRGNNFRTGGSYGTADIKNEKLTKVWQMNIGAINTFTGVGWNGQPAIVRWDAETRQIMNLYPEKKAKDGLIEVIYAAMDGRVRFLDIDDGSQTRDTLILSSPIKGSVTLDPRGYPLMFIGEGAFVGSYLGFHIFSLIDGQELYFLNGADPFALRFWRSFDGNGLLDAANDTLVQPAENGVLYTIKLNTNYDKTAGTISIDPEFVKYRYRSALSPTLGIENSVAAFSHYAFFADNSGLVQCLDLDTMTPVWMRHCTDDTDASLVLDVEDGGGVGLYTACQVDKQGPGGRSYIRKLDAATGALLWEHSYPCAFDANVNGGALGSPIIGRNDIDGGVIFFIAKVQTGQGGGVMVNLDKETGEVIWETYLRSYGWSSPVAVYTGEGKSYIVVCDAVGNMFLLDGASGKVIDNVSVGSNVEGSPAIFENRIVVGTRFAQIHGLVLG